MVTAVSVFIALLCAEAAAEPAVKITRTFLNSAEISPLQYGQFMEYLCDLFPSMWAEKLYDGSFEGLTPYKVAFIKQTDFREKPWYPSGATNRAAYSLDRTDPVSGAVSQKIAAGAGAPCRVGIGQNGIAVQQSKACLLTCYLRCLDVHKPVMVELHRDGKLYASAEFHPTGEWKKFRARLVPSGTDSSATLSISFHGPGTLWIDNASLMPEDTVHGWRADVVAAVRELKPGIIRYGGSTLDDANLGDFEWKDTIGDPDKRRPFRAWGGLQPTGPGLGEFIDFCRTVGAEPLICVRFSRRTPNDAAEQVEYFNGPVTTTMGALRSKHGHPEPYRVRYWQVGNERAGQEYEARLAAFCQAMKDVDPTIKLLSSYPTPGVLQKAGPYLDYVCPHHYDIANLAAAENDLLHVSAMSRANQPDRKIKIAVTEWNTTAGDWGPRRARLWTLENALACSRYHNLLHRHCDVVEIANRSNLTNSFCSGIIQTDNHRLYKTPTYYAQQLYATHAGNRPLKIESDPAPNSLPDLSATLTSDGSKVVLFAVNDSPGDVARFLDFSEFGGGEGDMSVWTLTDKKRAGEPDVTNSFADPDRVAPVAQRFKSPGRFRYRFPAFSLTALQWSVGK